MCIDHSPHLGELLSIEAAFGKASDQRGAGLRLAPDFAKFGFIAEQFGQLAEQAFDELRGCNRLARCIPVGGRAHMLERAFLAVGERNHQRP